MHLTHLEEVKQSWLIREHICSDKPHFRVWKILPFPENCKSKGNADGPSISTDSQAKRPWLEQYHARIAHFCEWLIYHRECGTSRNNFIFSVLWFNDFQTEIRDSRARIFDFAAIWTKWYLINIIYSDKFSRKFQVWTRSSYWGHNTCTA